MDEKIVTQHPQGKKGFNISKQKYDVIRAAILEALQPGGALTHGELENALKQKLTGSFEGSIPWYLEVVKLDLEARKEIEREPDGAPERYRLASS